MTLIISSETDLHARSVISQLDALGAPWFLFDLARYPREYALTIRHDGPRGERRTLLTRAGEVLLDFAEVTAAWWRRPGTPEVGEEITRPEHQKFALTEAHEAITGLWHSLSSAHWVNEPGKDDLAHRKVYQLDVATDVGLRIPETCITSDPAAARAFVERMGEGGAICKAFSATWDQWRETRIVGPAELDALDNVRFAPVIFQEYIEAHYDLRITAIGDRFFPAAIYAGETDYPVDVRMDIGRARTEAVALPPEVELGLLTLMQRLGLVYGAIDMRLTPEGEYVFLEVNPAGQWLFIEEKTKQPIARYFAGYLASAGMVKGSATDVVAPVGELVSA